MFDAPGAPAPWRQRFPPIDGIVCTTTVIPAYVSGITLPAGVPGQVCFKPRPAPGSCCPCCGHLTSCAHAQCACALAASQCPGVGDGRFKFWCAGHGAPEGRTTRPAGVGCAPCGTRVERIRRASWPAQWAISRQSSPSAHGSLGASALVCLVPAPPGHSVALMRPPDGALGVAVLA